MTNTQKQFNVLFWTAWYPTKTDFVNGVFVKEHALAAARRHNVTVAVSSIDSNLPSGRFETASEQFEGLLTHRLTQGIGWPPKFRYLTRLRREIKFLNHIIEKHSPDIIHAVTHPAAVSAAIVCRRLKLPFVVSEHYSGFYRSMIRGAELLKARFALRRANLVLPVCSFLETQIKSHGINARFEILPNVINSDIFYLESNRKTSQTRQYPQALTVASLLPIKGIDILVEAVGKLIANNQHIELTIIGEGPERSAIESRLSELNLAKYVHLPGAKPKSEIARMMHESDFYILPSRGENAPVAPLEAMACGLPVVGTSVGAMPEYITPERGMITEPDNPEALANAIHRMMLTYIEYDRNSISSYILNNFSTETVSARMDEIYQSVLGS